MTIYCICCNPSVSVLIIDYKSPYVLNQPMEKSLQSYPAINANAQRTNPVSVYTCNECNHKVLVGE